MIGRRFSTFITARSSSYRNLANPIRLSNQARWLSLPTHKVVAMPSLSPTMESGSISKWNINVGDRFEAGTSLCDVETDKATVSFDATDDGYLAKILVSSGETKVGQPLLITVEEKEDVAAFANFQLADAKQEAAKPAADSAPKPVAPPATKPVENKQPIANKPSDRIFASPLAKKIIRESNQTLENINQVIGGTGSGPNGRVVASDVQKALTLNLAQLKEPVVASSPSTASTTNKTVLPSSTGVYVDFEVSDIAKALIDRQTYSKQTVPHYHVSVEINLNELMKIRSRLNSRISPKNNADGLSVLDFIVKAAAQTMHQVPDINASWMDTFVRRYEQVDINLVMGSGQQIATPNLKDVASKGLTSISKEIAKAEKALFESDNNEEVLKFIQDEASCSLGTFSIYNLGIYGVKAAAPIVLTPQAASLSVGAIVDTVIPKTSDDVDGRTWEVAPVMVATLSCDHRVVDGATSAQWLAAFKTLLENPETLLL